MLPSAFPLLPGNTWPCCWAVPPKSSAQQPEQWGDADVLWHLLALPAFPRGEDLFPCCRCAQTQPRATVRSSLAPSRRGTAAGDGPWGEGGQEPVCEQPTPSLRCFFNPRAVTAEGKAESGALRGDSRSRRRKRGRCQHTTNPYCCRGKGPSSFSLCWAGGTESILHALFSWQLKAKPGALL